MEKQNAPENKNPEQVQKASEKADSAFHWTADEYIQQRKGPKWYLIAGIVVILTIIYSIITYNWTLVIAVVVFAGVYEYMQRHHPPKKVEIRITAFGIHVGQMFFPYSSIKAFWILYGNGVQTLNLRVHRRVHSDVVIQLDSQDPASIREYLVGQIPEWEGKQERLGDVITRLLKL